MAKKTTPNNKPANNGLPPGENYANKPFIMGKVIEELVIKKGLDEKFLAPHVERYWRSLYRWYDRTYLTIPEMMNASEALQENLFLLYHPNVKPLPSVEEALRKELEEVKKERDELRNDLIIEKNHGLKLEGKIEVLEEQAAEFWRRRG